MSAVNETETVTRAAELVTSPTCSVHFGGVHGCGDDDAAVELDMAELVTSPTCRVHFQKRPQA